MSVQHIFWVLLWFCGGNRQPEYNTAQINQEKMQAGQGLAMEYPGDEGIKEHPSVLFADNFETGELEDLENRWGYVSNRDGEVLSFSDEVPAGSAGIRSLKMTATRGKNEGGELYKVFDSGWDKVYLRFYTKFAEDHGIYHHFVALRGFADPLPYPTGGAGQLADNHFSVTIEPQFAPKIKPNHPLGIWKFYAYWPEMRSWQSPDGKPDGIKPNPYYGNSFQPREPMIVPRGEWIAVKIMLKLNSSPKKAMGKRHYGLTENLSFILPLESLKDIFLQTVFITTPTILMQHLSMDLGGVMIWT
jgi:hypothetical protein